MSSKFLTRTIIGRLTPLTVSGQAVHTMLPQIRAFLQARLGKRHADLFAEPVPHPGKGEIEWRTGVPGEVRAFTSLSEAERQQARQQLRALLEDIDRLVKELEASGTTSKQVMAQTILQALEVPNESYFFLVGDQPVIAAWGHHETGSAAPYRVLWRLSEEDPASAQTADDDETASGGTSHAPGPEGAATAAGPAASAFTGASSGTADSEGSTEAASPPAGDEEAVYDGARANGPGGETQWYVLFRRPVGGGAAASGGMVTSGPFVALDSVRPHWLAWLLWALFFLLLFVIFWLLLRACALGLPFGYSPPWLANFCSAPVASQRSSMIADLETRLRSLEASLAERQRACNREAAAQPEEEEDTALAETCRRLCRDRAEHQSRNIIGNMNVLMKWDNRDDLDLLILCPDGSRVGVGTSRGCGAKYALDVNFTEFRDHPIENVIWEDEAPAAGTYRILVRRYKDNAPTNRKTAFRVEVLVDGRLIRSVEGALEKVGKDTWKEVLRITLPDDVQQATARQTIPQECDCSLYR